MAGVRRVVPMIFGWEHLALRYSRPLIEEPLADELMREPVPGLLLEVDGGWVLVDSGLNTPLVRDPSHYSRYWGNEHIDVEIPGPTDGDPLTGAFELAGVDPRDVVALCISHFHNDHVGGLRHFAGRVPVYVQRAEHDWATADAVRAETEAMFRIDWDDPRVDWRFLDGDAVIAPGVEAILTAGHTPGHQSFVVDLDETVVGDHEFPGYVFACDAADLQANIDNEEPVTAPEGWDHSITLEAIRRMKSIAAGRGYRVLPGHDPEVWPAFAAERGVKVFESGTLYNGVDMAWWREIVPGPTTLQTGTPRTTT